MSGVCLLFLFVVAYASESISNCQSTRWIAISESKKCSCTSTLESAAQLQGWCTVFYSAGYFPIPTNLSTSKTVVLEKSSLESAFQKLSLRTTRQVQGFLVRKNIGFLFAALNGATEILELECGALLLADPIQVIEKATAYTFLNTSINPMAYFGQPSIWPRGFPLTAIGETSTHFSLASSGSARPVIHHTLTSGVPDVDDVFLLTRRVHEQRMDVAFTTQPPLALVGDAYVPLPSHGTIFTREAFWAAGLPAHQPLATADVRRGYFAQRLLREVPGAVVAVHGHLTHRSDDGALHSSHRRMELARDLGRVAASLTGVEHMLVTVQSWTRPPAATTMQQAATALALHLVREGIWSSNDTAVLEDFWHDLAVVGCPLPPLGGAVGKPGAQSSAGKAVAPQLGLRLVVGRQTSTPALPAMEQVAPGAWDTTHLQSRVSLQWRHALQVVPDGSRIQPHTSSTLSVTPPSPLVPCSDPQMTAILLVPKVLFVVNFHWAGQANNASIRMLIDLVFSHYFNTPFDVVFVGPGAGSPGVLGNGLGENGFLSYHSLAVAYEHYPGYEGYFLVNDDAFLVQPRFEASLFAWHWQYPWTIGNNFPICLVGGGWVWEHGCGQLIKVYNQLCGDTFRGDPGCSGPHAFYGSQADFFYVPARLMPAFKRWSLAFVQAGIFLELAVGTILRAISDVQCDTFQPGISADIGLPLCTWFDGSRPITHLLMVFGRHDHFCYGYHPIKLSNPEVRKHMEDYFARISRTRCNAEPCTLSYSPDPDGFLWRRV
jgi:hypothetical protein